MIRVIKEPTDVLNFANAWHSDLSYLPEPPAYTLLHAWEVPSHGGDTLWSNQYLAYETLSPGSAATLDGLEAVHSAGLAYGTGGLLDQVQDLTSMAIAPSAEAYAEQVHPVVARPSGDGPRARSSSTPIYTVRFKGWTKDESQTLLDHLYRCSVNENFTCRLRWSVHTLAIWDNRCTMHNALERLRRRATRDVPHQRQGLDAPGTGAGCTALNEPCGRCVQKKRGRQTSREPPARWQ